MANPPPSTPQRRSSRASAVNAKESIRSISARSSGATPSASPASAPRKKRPAAELLGKRIAVNWPGNRTMYEARVVDYIAKRKLHKVIYDSDNSIEEVNLARRKFKLLDLTPAEKEDGTYLGLRISLPPRHSASSGANATSNSDYMAMVIGIVDPEEIPAADPADEDPTAPRTFHKVLYLTNEYVAEVNLASTKFIILDSTTNEPIRTVNEGLELVELDEPIEEVNEPDRTADASSSANDKSKTDATPEDKLRPGSKKTVGNTPKKKSKDLASNSATQLKPNTNDPKSAQPKNIAPLQSTTATVKAAVTSTILETSDKAGASVSKVTSSPVTKQQATLATKLLPELAGKDTNVHIPETSVASEVTLAVTVKPHGAAAASSAQADAANTVIKDGTTTVSKDESSEHVDGAPMAIDTELNKSTGNAITDALKPERASASTGISATANGSESAKEVNPSSNVNLAPSKPLTAENLSYLESSAPANGSEAMDEDAKTVSVGDDKWIEASANAVKNPKELKSKFIALKHKNTERIAYVEDFLSNGTHFVAFQDKEGGNMQMLLTTENFRVMPDEEVEKMSKNRKRSIPSNVVNGKVDEALKSSKRRRSAGTAVASQKPVAGGDLVGKVISVRWPGNGGNYLALVVGFQQTGNRRKHKVYYVEDESTEVIDLTKRDWVVETSGPWDSQGLVGKRLYVYWDGNYTDNDVDQKRAEAKFGMGNTKIPFEAFVVKFISSFRYRLLYTQDDNLEDRDLTQEDDAWDILDAGMQRVDNLPLISWSGPISD